jgi:hypothetical protein
MYPKETSPQVDSFLKNVMFPSHILQPKTIKWQHLFGTLLTDNHLMQSQNINDDTFHNCEKAMWAQFGAHMCP